MNRQNLAAAMATMNADQSSVSPYLGDRAQSASPRPAGCACRFSRILAMKCLMV
jgi:hypothetical protein